MSVDNRGASPRHASGCGRYGDGVTVSDVRAACERLQRSREAVDRDLAAYYDAICDAVRSGASRAEVAEAAGLSKSGVNFIVRVKTPASAATG